MNKYTNTLVEDLMQPLGGIQRAWLRRSLILVLTPLIFIIEGLGGIVRTCYETLYETYLFIKENW